MLWMTGEEWSKVLDISLNGFFNVTQPLLKNMLVKRYGRIVNIVSLSRIQGMTGQTNNSAAKGGVYTFDSTVTFDSVAEVPAGATFSTDKAVTSEGLGGTTTTVKSEATVILFKTDAEGNKVMPPVYLQAPVYLFRSADGNHCYKVLFTQYQDENKESGHVIFSFAEVK